MQAFMPQTVQTPAQQQASVPDVAAVAQALAVVAAAVGEIGEKLDRLLNEVAESARPRISVLGSNTNSIAAALALTIESELADTKFTAGGLCGLANDDPNGPLAAALSQIADLDHKYAAITVGNFLVDMATKNLAAGWELRFEGKHRGSKAWTLHRC